MADAPTSSMDKVEKGLKEMREIIVKEIMDTRKEMREGIDGLRAKLAEIEKGVARLEKRETSDIRMKKLEAKKPEEEKKVALKQ